MRRTITRAGAALLASVWLAAISVVLIARGVGA